MTQKVLLRGIDVIRDRVFSTQSWSGKVYLVDPRDQRLWDLKIALREAAIEGGIDLHPTFRTNTYRPDLLKIGISYVCFERDTKRSLGVCGNDLSELLDPHILYTPDRKKIENGAQDFILSSHASRSQDGHEIVLAYESGVRRRHARIERQMSNARKIKEAQGLVCRGCEFDAEAAYGKDYAMSYMDAHHLLPVADTPEGGRQMKLEDFAVLCATCHRLIHRMNAPDDLPALKTLIAKGREKQAKKAYTF
jgi:hypothetical protein